MRHKISAIVRFLLNRRRRESQLDSEFRFHIERQIEENIRRGMKPEKVRRAARQLVAVNRSIKPVSPIVWSCVLGLTR
ncbi:MAG TPA: permease prefix domain 1-containing protein [Bryobacteraceae bacterium]|jgi:hypothetical protein